ncbi:hypothetical protein [Nocardioides sp. AE5]|uniref:hypothetical protein n=1 Tax=Nocardioides sp. AE5 TaxID=2962573 RepID=UPI00288196D3|nr:hypothetical protein [Nocardioides sp. AE5]MDT0200867.1 hypothetical protein [Nocardioides sp. AE5]
MEPAGSAAPALELAGRGASVVVADVDGDAAASVASQAGGEAWQVDLSDTDALVEASLEATSWSTTPASSGSARSPTSTRKPSG